ncbi:MAG: LPS assembly lipoprotein LptE [Desulfopila sp.]
MKKTSILTSIACIALLITAACGYYNPYVYSGPDKTIYITSWKNRTSDLQLDSDIYQSLLQWFQKSASLSVVSEKDGADLILAGEIVSIDLPSLSYGSGNTTREVKLKLRLRYILKDLQNGKVLFQEPDTTRSEEYVISSNTAITNANEDNALEILIDELSQDIYRQVLSSLTPIE